MQAAIDSATKPVALSESAPIDNLRALAERYKAALQRNPHEPQALAGLALIALASRQPGAAVRMAQAAVLSGPEMVPAWVILGQALRADGRGAEAEEAYNSALRLDGTNALARVGMGELKIAAGRPGKALGEFEQAICRAPALVPAHLGMGHALSCLSRFAEALDSYERALSIQPRLAEAEFAAGFALARLSRKHEAVQRYRRAVALRPDFAAAWMNLGSLLRGQGRELLAEAALKRAVAMRPDLIAGWVNLSLLERETGRTAEAREHLRRAFALDPEQVGTHVALAQFCYAEKDFAGAWGWVRWALAQDEKNEEAHNMMGILLHAEGRFGEAVEAFRSAEALGSVPAISNRGNSLLDMGRFAEALRAHDSAVALEPQNSGARYNLALTQLRLGNWTDGWRNYEARWLFREVHRRPRVFDRQRWQGEPLDGQRVLLHAEQGLGDTIQFCRYAALVAARGGRPILQVQEPVARLMGSLAVVRAGLAQVVQLGLTPPELDLECPLMSLPAVFGTVPETTPWSGAYLGAAGGDTERRFPDIPTQTSGGLRVGIAWAGNPRYKADRHRSVHLRALLPLLEIPGVTWVSLQKGDAAAQLGELPAGFTVIDGSSRDRDLADTAELVATLDFVVSTDTCIAHLAGAMGKPVWILLPHLADWRWMQDLETTPWYPTARLFRQTSVGDWTGVLERVAGRLHSVHQEATMREKGLGRSAIRQSKPPFWLSRLFIDT
ncbi:MAG TPA: tetratricopeptide repeat protein [Terracidiphilus sp.]|nr:tetratricopeptide repeat protein [Bryobacteraceae bacterium]HKF47457.1 tetratricopeptide repeat protein [Terracidiphilus sp.]